MASKSQIPESTIDDRREWANSLLMEIERAVLNYIGSGKIPFQDKEEWQHRVWEYLVTDPGPYGLFKENKAPGKSPYPYVRKLMSGLLGDYLAAHPGYGWQQDKESSLFYTTYHQVHIDGEKMSEMFGSVPGPDPYSDEIERRDNILELQQMVLETIGNKVKEYLGEDYYVVWQLSRVARSNVEISVETGFDVDKVLQLRESSQRLVSYLRVNGISIKKFFVSSLEDISAFGGECPRDWEVTCTLDSKIACPDLSALLGESEGNEEKEEQARHRAARKILRPNRRASSSNRPRGIRDDEVTSREVFEILGSHLVKYRNPWSQLKQFQQKGRVLITRAFGEGNTKRYYYARASILDLRKQLDTELEAQLLEREANRLEQEAKNMEK